MHPFHHAYAERKEDLRNEICKFVGGSKMVEMQSRKNPFLPFGFHPKRWEPLSLN